MRYALGKKPARPDAVSLKFGAVFDRSKLPPTPLVFGHEAIHRAWKMLGNDERSDCVFAGAAHEQMVWDRIAGNPPSPFETQCVLDDYAAVTGFDPLKPDSDQGTDMTDAASFRRRVGIQDALGNRHKIDAYVSVRGWDDMMTAIHLFGAGGVGLSLPETADAQFDRHEPWSIVKGAEIVGGHYVAGVGRNSKGRLLVVTWGGLQAVDRDYYEAYCDEAICYLNLDVVRNRTTPEGFDEASLRNFLSLLKA